MSQSERTVAASCANFLARTLFLALQETLGGELFTSLLIKGGLEGLVDCSIPDNEMRQFPLQRLERLFEGIAEAEGVNVQRGLLQRSGRTWFYSLSRHPSLALNLFASPVLTLPRKLKIKRCAEILAEYFDRYIEGVSFVVIPSPELLEWRFKLSCCELGAMLGNGLADLWLGFWYELLYGVSGGKPHLLGLTACAEEAQPSWVIRIPYLPLDG